MEEIKIPCQNVILDGLLSIPKNSRGIVIFAHGSGSSRLSSRNQYVAKVLQQVNFTTLLFDLLTAEEDEIDSQSAEYRFDIPFLADRLVRVTNWLTQMSDLSHLPIGYFGASTGGGAALVAAAKLPEKIKAVVSRGGRPDLAGDALSHVKAATLLIVGGDDYPVINMNEEAYQQLNCIKKLEIIPGATHLFEEKGKLEQVAQLAQQWFEKYLS